MSHNAEKSPLAKANHIWKRNGVFYVRKRVPTHLVQTLGRTEINKSLKTSDYREAKRRAVSELEKFELSFELAEKELAKGCPGKPSKIEELSLRDLIGMVDQWYEDHRVDLMKNWSFVAPGCTEPEDVDELLMERDQTIALITDQLKEAAVNGGQYDPGVVSTTTDAILMDAGLPKEPSLIAPNGKPVAFRPTADKSSDQYTNLRDLVNEASVRLMSSYLDFLKGDVTEISYQPSRDATGLSLQELVDAFLSDPRKADISYKRSVDYRMAFRILLETLGKDTPIRSLTRANLREVANIVRKIPKNCTKILPGLSYSDAIRIAEERDLDRLGPTTVSVHLQKISTLFKWATAEDLIDRNLATGLADPGSGTHTADQRHSFSINDLTKIFSSSLLEILHSKEGEAWFWVPLISLFHGMRLNEICQLTADDVRHENGISFFDIAVSDGIHRVKTAHSIRRVPLHPEIVSLGILQYIDRMKSGSSDQLFPELPLARNGYRSRKVTRWFGPYIRACGIADPKKTFHSLRHTWRDAARENNLNGEIADQIGGWARGGTSSKYGSGYSLASLDKEIQKIAYPDLDLSHLKRG